MAQPNSIRKYFTLEQLLPVSGFAVVMIGFSLITWLALASLAADYADYASAADLLDRLEGRKLPGESASHASGMRGSPFLEGSTVNVAGAALQQRVVAAVQDAGGNVLSSQIDLQASESRPGYVNLSASCDIGESALQELIYDLESGMPFLFIDQLVIQVPQGESGSGTVTARRMRLQIDVSGQWQAEK
jgi:general secretion pathway protein M